VISPLSICAYIFALLVACGPLPRPRLFDGSVGQTPVSSSVTGLVFTSADVSYSSSDIYFYDFITGVVKPLAAGESGDVLTRWQFKRLWIFNRSSGRVSYSHVSPKEGATSRSVERRTPMAQTGDPSELLALGQGTLALAMGSAHKVMISNLLSNPSATSDLGAVDTGDQAVPFRPGTMTTIDGDLWVLHQHLGDNWKATGPGRLFTARQSKDGSWGWVDQSPTSAGTQGILLNVSNPVLAFKSQDRVVLIGGICYQSMGASCVAGVDAFDTDSRTVQHLFDLPSGYESIGPMVSGPSSQKVLLCLKQDSHPNAKIVSISVVSGLIEKTWDTGMTSCGPFYPDKDGSRVFVVKSSAKSSELHILNSDLQSLSKIDLPFPVTGMELVDE
jgi:hypothetical protein